MRQPDELRTYLAGQPDTETAARNAIAVYREARLHAKTAAQEWDAVADEAKALLGDIIAETGCTTWKFDEGSAYLPAPGLTVSYDAKALDALCASDDGLKRLLWPHRQERERAGSLTIR